MKLIEATLEKPLQKNTNQDIFSDGIILCSPTTQYNG